MRSDQVSQGFIQFHLRTGTAYSLARQPAPLLGCPYGEETFPYIQSEPLLFQLTTTVSCLPTMYCREKPGLSP